jgi:hypothetical protein
MQPASSSGGSKRSWPLLALAVLAFVPGLGVIFGSAAVSWGLVSDRPRARLAIALGAVGALVQMLGGLGLALWMRDTPMAREIQATTARADLARLVSELDAYRTEAGRYPQSLQTLIGYPIPRRLINIYDQSAGVFRQRPYTYRVAPDGRTFDLLAVGPDGVPDTPDDIRPQLADSILRRTGYRAPPLPVPSMPPPAGSPDSVGAPTR